MKLLSYGLTLANAGFVGPIGVAKGAVNGFASSLSKAGNIITGFASLPGAIRTLVEPFTQPITLAGDMEALETSFKALLKNGPAAKAMVKDLIEFADVTPFDPVPVAAAGKQLLAFSFAAKEVKPLLKDIGDLSAGMEKPIEEVADAFGRMKAGQFGEAFERMRAFGISMQDLKGEGLKFDSSGSYKGSVETAIEGVRRIIRRKFGGGMNDLSTTFKGLFSTFQGYWDGLQRSFGRPMMQALKPALESGTDLLKQWTPMAKTFGEGIGKGLIVVQELFKNGDLWKVAANGLKWAGAELINQLNAGFKGVVAGLFANMAGAASILQKIVGESGIWDGIGKKMESVFLGLKSILLETFADVMENLPGILGGGKGKGNALLGGSLIAKGQAGLASNAGDRAFSSVDLEGIVTEIGKAFQGTTSAFKNAYQNAEPVIPTGEYAARLDGMISPLLAKADAFFSVQNGDEPAKKTASKVEGILKFIDNNGLTIVRNLQLIADKIETGQQGLFAS